MVDVTDDALRLGYPVLTDPSTRIDPAATRMVPSDSPAIGVELADGVLGVVLDHVPSAAEVLSLEEVTGCEVTVSVATPGVHTALRERVSAPDRVPEALDALLVHSATLTRVTLSPGTVPVLGDGSRVWTLPGFAPLNVNDVERAGEWLLGLRRHGVVPWAGRRWRVTCSTSAGAPTLTMRAAGADIAPTLTGLGLPSALTGLTELAGGLVLVASPPNHGRSSTLTALADRISSQRSVWATRVCDSDEYQLPERRARLTTRLVGVDVPCAADGITDALRDATSLILLDVTAPTADDVDAALRAALSGVLVLAAVPAGTVADAVVTWMLPVEQPRRAATFAALAQTWQAGIAQRLLPGTSPGRVPAVEVWWRTPALAAALAAGDLAGVRSASYDVPDAGRRNIDMSAAVEALVAGGRASGAT